jgi:hypothetical protein
MVEDCKKCHQVTENCECELPSRIQQQQEYLKTYDYIIKKAQQKAAIIDLMKLDNNGNKNN